MTLLECLLQSGIGVMCELRRWITLLSTLVGSLLEQTGITQAHLIYHSRYYLVSSNDDTIRMFITERHWSHV